MNLRDKKYLYNRKVCQVLRYRKYDEVTKVQKLNVNDSQRECYSQSVCKGVSGLSVLRVPDEYGKTS